MTDLSGKFALVTGGAQGIGFGCIREFLKNKIQGVTLIDYNEEKGSKSTELLNKEFGEGKVIFMKVDVSNKIQFEDAFKQSIKHWKHLDIVLNNAGIMAEINWESCLAVNCAGVVQGTLLGFEYMSKNKNGRGGIIINMSSRGALIPFPTLPTYTGTKSFVIGFSRSLGDPIYFNHNAVKVLTICPCATVTDILIETKDKYLTHLCPNLEEIQNEHCAVYTSQTTEELAKNLLIVMEKGASGSVWLIAKNRATEIDFSVIDKQCDLY